MTSSDLMTRAEVAELLRVSVRKLANGWGPVPLPVAMYCRPRMYLRATVESWLLSGPGSACSTNAAMSGTSDSNPTGSASTSPRAKEIVTELRLRDAASIRRATSLDPRWDPDGRRG